MKEVFLALKIVGVALVAYKMVREYKDGNMEISADGLKDMVDIVTGNQTK